MRFTATICDAAGAPLKRVRGELSFEAALAEAGGGAESAAGATYALHGSYRVADCAEHAPWSEACAMSGRGRVAAHAPRACAIEIETTERRGEFSFTVTVHANHDHNLTRSP